MREGLNRMYITDLLIIRGFRRRPPFAHHQTMAELALLLQLRFFSAASSPDVRQNLERCYCRQLEGAPTPRSDF